MKLQLLKQDCTVAIQTTNVILHYLGNNVFICSRGSILAIRTQLCFIKITKFNEYTQKARVGSFFTPLSSKDRFKVEEIKD